MKKIKFEVPHFLQGTDESCWWYSMKMIAKYHRYPDLKGLAEVIYSSIGSSTKNPKVGLSPITGKLSLEIGGFAEVKGVNFGPKNSTINDLINTLTKFGPLLWCIKLDKTNEYKEIRHCAVITGASETSDSSDEGGIVWVNDPAEKVPRQLPLWMIKFGMKLDDGGTDIGCLWYYDRPGKIAKAFKRSG